jgi:hypothetical protein
MFLAPSLQASATCGLQVRPSGIEPGAPERPPISIGAVGGVTLRGAI